MSNFGQIQASLIISVYKNTKFLEEILRSLGHQTCKHFEVIISEDGDSREMREFLASGKFPFLFQHLTQEDLGCRKNQEVHRFICKNGFQKL